MIKILFYVLVAIPACIHLFVSAKSPRIKWWENLLVVLAVAATYTMMIYVFYADQRIGEVLLVISAVLVSTYVYFGSKTTYKKWRL